MNDKKRMKQLGAKIEEANDHILYWGKIRGDAAEELQKLLNKKVKKRLEG